MKTIKLRRPVLLSAMAAAIFAIGACETKTEVKNQPTASPSPAVTASPAISPEVANPNEAAIQQLIGKWAGPEGTFITITEKKGADGKQQLPRKFEIEIKDLDKAEKYEGTAKGKDIEFVRKGKTETVKAATGAETGMKGFEKETACVVVTKGSEGFCKRSEVKPAASAKASPTEPSPSASPARK